MQTMHPVILHGRTVWDRARLPLDEFEERVRVAQQTLAAEGLDGLAVYGNCRSYGMLAYFSNYVPRLGWGVLLIPADGAPILAASVVGDRELAYVKSLAWMDGVFNANKLRDLLGSALGGEKVAFAGRDDMPESLWSEIEPLLPGWMDGDEIVDAMMRRKRPRELSVLRDACGVLSQALDAARAGAVEGALGSAIRAERAARELGALDARVLCMDPAGPGLLPYQDMWEVGKGGEPFTLYVAVNLLGYWADAVFCSAPPQDLWAAAQADLDALLARIVPGTPVAELAEELMTPARGEPHPLCTLSLGSGIGLSLEEQPHFLAKSGARVERGATYSLRLGRVDKSTGAQAWASAVVAADERGLDVMQRA